MFTTVTSGYSELHTLFIALHFAGQFRVSFHITVWGLLVVFVSNDGVWAKSALADFIRIFGMNFRAGIAANRITIKVGEIFICHFQNLSIAFGPPASRC